MKKYAIIIGENNEETSRKVQEALFAVGFEWPNGGHCSTHSDAPILFVNAFEKNITYRGTYSTLSGEEDINDAEILNPSYVIAHAAELDGARKPWEVAPEGCKILSHNECIKHNNESHDGIMYYSNLSSAWKSAGYINAADTAVAVPADFTFAPIEPEIEVDGTALKVGDYITALKNLASSDRSWVGDELKVLAIDKRVIVVDDISCKGYANRVTIIFDDYVFQRLSDAFYGEGEIEVDGKMYKVSELNKLIEAAKPIK